MREAIRLAALRIDWPLPIVETAVLFGALFYAAIL
jgi:hypothetical protein